MNKLTRKEEQIMQVIWQLGNCFVYDVIAHLPEPKPHYNTVSTIVRALKEKGYVGHKAYGKTHEYFPIVELESYRKQFFSKLVKDYFANSYKSVVSFLAQEKNISVEELKEIIEMIENPKDENHG